MGRSNRNVLTTFLEFYSEHHATFFSKFTSPQVTITVSYETLVVIGLKNSQPGILHVQTGYFESMIAATILL